MRLCVTLTAGFLLLAGCRKADERIVQVNLELPPRVEADVFRLMKVVEGRATEMEVEKAGARHQVGIILPRHVTRFFLRAQAANQMLAVAEGEAEIEAPIDAKGASTLVLVSCAVSFRVGREFVSCLDRRDGGVDGPRDAAADAREASRDAGRDAFICQGAVTGAPPVNQPPPDASPGCADYCAAMEEQCSSVFLGRERCLFACAELGWKEPGGFNTNTLGCRTLWARIPPDTPDRAANKCKYAAPASFGRACGEFCEIYCFIGARLCPRHFPDEVDCVPRCLQARERWRMEHDNLDPDKDMFCRLDRLEKVVFDRRLCEQAAPDVACGDCPPIRLE
jgi:hypothetical protein